MSDIEAANLIILKARVVESLATRARRKSGGPSHLPEWATEPGGVAFVYAVRAPEQGAEDFPANITFKMTHTDGNWAISVIVAVTVGVVDGSAAECASSLRAGEYDSLGIAAWPEIRHAARQAACSIEARVSLPTRHPLFWEGVEETRAAASS